MRVLLINNGESGETRPRELMKKYIPNLSDRLKSHAALVLPDKVLRLLLSGFGVGEKRFPLGLGYLSAMLRQNGHSVCLIDRFADPGDWRMDVRSFDFVGVYTSTPCYADALRILHLLRKDRYEGPIAFGGPHASFFPETIPPEVDYIVQGEGEYIINDLVEGRYPSGIILRTQRIQDLDALPSADYELFTDRKRSYRMTMPYSEQGPVFSMNTSRSCPLNCSFCTVRDIWGRLWRGQSAERITDDILRLKREYNIAGVYFREDFFPADRKRVRQFCEILLRKNIRIVWACENRADAASDEELVKLMAESGCRGFYLGAESGSQRMLDHYHKKITVEQIIRACELAKKYGIAVAMSLIVANPVENMKDRTDTWKMVRRTRPEILYVNAYRDEFCRHGNVDFPVYPARKSVDADFENGTWRGQKDRLKNCGGRFH